MRGVQDIANTIIKTVNGTPIRMKDLGTIAQGPKIRLGQIGKAIHRSDGKVIDDGDVVEGIVLLRKGADADAVLDAIHAKVDQLNHHILPRGVQVVPFLDRSSLVHLTTHTVLHNLTEGIVLVALILFLFLGNARGALIVALTIPFSLLFAAICLNLNHIPANLLSLGALDFGMVVEGAVVIVENIVRYLGRHEGVSPLGPVRAAAHEVQRPVFYSIGIIITAYLPIFTLQRVEGRLFKPMAWTVTFALLGSLLFSLLIAPVLASFVFGRRVREWPNPVMNWITRVYEAALRAAVRLRWPIVMVAAGALGVSIYLATSGIIGSEFLPHLDEGAIWARATLAPSTGPSEGERVMRQARRVFASFPEVTQVVSQVGRPDDGTDTTGFFNTEYFVDLKPKAQWRPIFAEDKEELISAMDREVEQIPGTLWNFSQPIADNMEEAVSGVKGELAIKIYGDDLKTLETTGDQIVNVLRTVDGITDLGLFRVIGQPNLEFEIDRTAAARYGINVTDVQDAVETAVGGKAVTQVLRGEQRYDLVLRYQAAYRGDRQAIENIRLLAPSGERISLAQLCQVRVRDGASEIYREGNSRYVALKYSVPKRDLGSTVEEAMRKVDAQVKLPAGYSIDWAGEYESAEALAKAADDRAAHHHPGDLHDPVHHVQVRQVGVADSGQRRHGADWRPAGVAHYPHPHERIFRHRLSGAVRRRRADGRDHARIHQPASRARPHHPQCRRRRIRAKVASHHDDHAGGQLRAVAGRAVARHRFRLAAPLCHRDRRRPGGRADPRHLPAAGALRLGGARAGQPAGARYGGGVSPARADCAFFIKSSGPYR